VTHTGHRFSYVRWRTAPGVMRWHPLQDWDKESSNGPRDQHSGHRRESAQRLMGASVGSLGTVRAQYHLRQILVTLNMPVVNQPEVMIGNAAQRFDQHGRLTDEPTRQFIQKLLGALLQLAKSPPGEQTPGCLGIDHLKESA
jgi:NADPH-dependent FMN reductase